MTAERWDGRRWTLATPPNPPGTIAYLRYGRPAGTTLNAVSCVSSRSCLAVGSYWIEIKGQPERLPLIERWNGGRWKRLPAALPAGAISGSLTGVACPSRDACVAAGSWSDPSRSSALALVWNGSKWSTARISTPPRATATSLTAVSCAAAGICIAIGSVAYETTVSARPLLVQLRKSRATVQPTPDQINSHSNTLTGVSCASPTACTAVGVQRSGVIERGFVER
jgi:hypothetical protein